MPHIEKVSTDLKMDDCKKYLAKNISIAEIAKALEVDHKTVERWILQYRSEGELA